MPPDPWPEPFLELLAGASDARRTAEAGLDLLEVVSRRQMDRPGDLSPFFEGLQTILAQDLGALAVPEKDGWRITLHGPLNGHSGARVAALEAMAEVLERTHGVPPSVLRVTPPQDPRPAALAGTSSPPPGSESPARELPTSIVLPLHPGPGMPQTLLGLFWREEGGSTDQQLRTLARLSPALGLSVKSCLYMEDLTSENLAIKMRQAELDRQLDLARQAQQHLIPREGFRSSQIEIETLYRPTLPVGGDLVEIVPLKDERVAVAVADVSGKGVGAALISAFVKGLLGPLLERADSPAQVLKEMNQHLIRHLDPHQFVTLTLLCVSPGSQQLTLASAGHEPVLHVSRERGRAEPLEVRSLPLGVLSDFDYQDLSRPLSHGDILYLYTDGAWNQRQEGGRERMLEEVAGRAVGGPRKDVSRWLARSLPYGVPRENRQEDDLAAVLIHVL